MPAPESAAQWYLKPVAVDGLSDRIPLVDVVTLGRADSNTVSLAERDHPHVSNHHARIVCGEDGSLQLEDLGSRNGTFVNDSASQSTTLADGDVVRLGKGGPAFVVEALAGSYRTQLIPPSPGKEQRAPMTQTTIVRVKRALGIPADTDVGDLMADSERRSRRRVRMAVVAAVGAVIATVIITRSLPHDELEQLAALNAQLEERLSDVSSSFESQQAAWEQQKQKLEKERSTLQERIQAVAREQTSKTELTSLRQALDDTNKRLQRYDPIVVERTREEGIGRVQRAVVFIETKVQMRNDKTQKLLRVKGTAMTFDDDGTVYTRDSSGSGFCINPDGLVVTNAHVVRPEGMDARIQISAEETLVPELGLAVVFSGDDQRHPATIVKLMADGEDDLALLEIEPFEGMPHIENFRTDTAAPATGAEVYLHGFPLGMMAVQEGRRMIASSFRGILSRTVSNWLQVDAAVHPGNSGGPLTDGTGRVIGVVTRVQRIDRDAIAPDMGYAIPIADVTSLLEKTPPAKSK